MKLIHKQQSEVTKDFVNNSFMVTRPETDAFIFRQQIHRLIDKLPFEELINIFEFDKFDPFSEEILTKAMRNELTTEEFERYRYYRDKECILYETKLITK